MKIKYLKLIFPLFVLILSSATLLIESIHPKAIADNNNKVAFSLYNQIAEQNNGNIFISPFSISTALAMTYAGADKITAEEMQKAMHFLPNDPEFHKGYGEYIKLLEANAKNNIQLRIANRLWGERKYKLQSSFIELNKQAYNSPLEKMNFSGNPDGSRIEINNWIEDKTEQRIKKLIPPGGISSNTRLVLTNAIYFKGDWLYQFDKNKTRKSKFNLANGNTLKTPFMNWKGGLPYYENGLFKMIKLPYKGEKQSMIIILPHFTENIDSIGKMVNTQTFGNLYDDYKPEVELSLPKFEMSLPLSLKDHLQALGIKTAFTASADFSKMTPANNFYISSVIHKAFIKIDEEGTEAAAATAVIVNVDSAPSKPEKPKAFIADHPFLFYIIDNETKAILFMGRLMKPGSSKDSTE